MYLNEKCLTKIEETVQPAQPDQNSLSHKISKGFDTALGVVGGGLIGHEVGNLTDNNVLDHSITLLGALAGRKGMRENPRKTAMVMAPALLAAGAMGNEISRVRSEDL